jgi:hypothetical protein
MHVPYAIIGHSGRRSQPGDYDMVALDGEEIAEGQGEDAGQPEDVDLPAFLTADLPEAAASMMAAE